VTHTLHVGTSGYSFDEWKGPFYPEKLKSKEMLAYYAERFDTVEVNYTFRATPSDATLEGWKKATPPGFLFTLKAHQRITHILKLESAAEPVAQAFVARGQGLGDKLGPVLFQCPPFLRFDAARLQSFLAALPSDLRAVFEFRHPSWSDAKPLLAERGAAWCFAETDEEPVAADFALPDAPLHYLRLRKSAYSEAELAAWARRIESALARGAEVFCYFKHEDQGIGPKLALTLKGLISPGK
jgi:uncharacterized protein YecE (DUF72 family)